MTSLVWFRNNLRVSDNTALSKACNDNNTVIGVYSFDPRQFQTTQFGFKKTGAFRAKFLMESVRDLQKQLETLNIPLIICYDFPEAILPKIISELKVTALYAQKEWTSEEVTVTNAVKEKLSNTVEWNEYYDQFLFHPDDIPYKAFSDTPRVFTDFRKKCEKYGEVRISTSKPQPQPITFNERRLAQFISFPSWEQLELQEPISDQRSAFPFKGGETQGLQRLHDYIWNSEAIATYKKTRNGLIGTKYSSKLSAWLANGSVSPKTMYWEVKKFEKKVKKNEDTYWMIFELIWRDFFKYVSLKHGDALFRRKGILNKSYSWNASNEKLRMWVLGNTRYPFVNANMKEIASTGWMSNRGRQNVASFWAKELKQDWRIGASYFESLLLDYDVHSNWGNWQYVSGVGNDPRDRKFNIERQAAHYDPDGAYTLLWNN